MKKSKLNTLFALWAATLSVIASTPAIWAEVVCAKENSALEEMKWKIKAKCDILPSQNKAGNIKLKWQEQLDKWINCYKQRLEWSSVLNPLDNCEINDEEKKMLLNQAQVCRNNSNRDSGKEQQCLQDSEERIRWITVAKKRGANTEATRMKWEMQSILDKLNEANSKGCWVTLNWLSIKLDCKK